MIDRRQAIRNLLSFSLLRRRADTTHSMTRTVRAQRGADGAGAREFIWRRTEDDQSFELGRIDPFDFRLSGTVLVAEHESPLRIDYEVACDAHWRTVSVCINQTYQARRRALRLDHDGRGLWRLDGSPAPTLTGCTDVDLGVSPSTNALPINRLGLKVGSSGAIRAAWVRFPSLHVVPSQQRYSRRSRELYEYRSVSSGYEAPIEVDRLGLPRRYADLWLRIAEGPAVDRPAPCAMKRGFADALVTIGLSPELDDAGVDFDWLVGGWAGDVLDRDPDGEVRMGAAEWWFAWVLGGRVMQDVWSSPPRPGGVKPRAESETNRRYGCTLRRFDHVAELWHATRIDPVRGAVTRLSGRREADQIVLIGVRDGQSFRERFYAIDDTSFLWSAETLSSDGTWRTETELRMRRID